MKERKRKKEPILRQKGKTYAETTKRKTLFIFIFINASFRDPAK